MKKLTKEKSIKKKHHTGHQNPAMNHILTKASKLASGNSGGYISLPKWLLFK